MLAIRMQRTGRKGHPMYRMIVQDSHRQPTSGKVVALLGSYNPHTKEVNLDKDKVEFYLKNGAQPSGRTIKVLSDEKIALPAWVKKAAADKQKSIKNIDKLRRNKQDEPETAPAEASAEESPAPEATAESTETSPEEAAASKETDSPESSVDESTDESDKDESAQDSSEKTDK
jgi:small subunit ribosomal protein S16